MAVTAPDRLYYTGVDEADELIAHDPFALLVGFALDQQVPVQTAFQGPWKLQQRLGSLDPGKVAATDPARLEEAFREKPAIHRFPGNMARRVQELAADGADLRTRISRLPGFGEMKVKSLAAVLWKRFGVAVAEEVAPKHPTLGDVDSAEALADYQAAKRARKAQMRAERSG